MLRKSYCHSLRMAVVGIRMPFSVSSQLGLFGLSLPQCAITARGCPPSANLAEKPLLCLLVSLVSCSRIVFVPEENLVPSEESTEEDQEDNLSTDSPSESLKLSEIGGGGGVRTEEELEGEVLFT